MLVVKDPGPESQELGYVCGAIERGELVLVPTDTVYGIAAKANDEAAVQRLYAAKGRDATKATAAVFASVGGLYDAFGDGGLTPRAHWAAMALLPGPWTLIVTNPGALWPWLTGGDAGAPIGVRVPAGARALPPIAATSANLAGEPTITRVRDLPPALAEQMACAIDAGDLGAGRRGTAVASTVLDLTAWETGGDVVVVRDDAGRAGIARAALVNAPST